MVCCLIVFSSAGESEIRYSIAAPLGSTKLMAAERGRDCVNMVEGSMVAVYNIVSGR